jgi:hypothetical protein
LLTLGERESGIARLEEAVAAYKDALMVRTREREQLRQPREVEGNPSRLVFREHVRLPRLDLGLAAVTRGKPP